MKESDVICCEQSENVNRSIFVCTCAHKLDVNGFQSNFSIVLHFGSSFYECGSLVMDSCQNCYSTN